MIKLDVSFCNGCSSFHDYDCRCFHVNKYIAGEEICINKNRSHIYFILSGSISIKEPISKMVNKYNINEMVLLIKKATYSMFAEEDCTILSLTFDQHVNICDRLDVHAIKRMSTGYEYKFHSLKMTYILVHFTSSVVDYVANDIGCKYIEQAKTTELFVIFRYYFSQKELFDFFYPILDEQAFFKILVSSFLPLAKNVKELAALTGYSVDSFNKMFMLNFHQSPYKWMMLQKTNIIKAKLREKHIPIKIIVDEFGFSSQSHLNTFCKRYLGGTFRQLRDMD